MKNNGVISSYAHRSNILKYRKQIIFMLGAVVLNFFICLLPFRALTLWIIIVPDEIIMSLNIESYYKILYFCRIMIYLNSAMNPILYNLMSSKFREGFLKLLQCKSFKNNKFKPGTRKDTFHTISTNLSSSNNGGDKRKESEIRRKGSSAVITCTNGVNGVVGVITENLILIKEKQKNIRNNQLNCSFEQDCDNDIEMVC